jgi:prolyl oligopeptidase
MTAYPLTRKGDDADDYHGELVPDPYRWLEDTNSPETAAWIAEQNEVTESFLARVATREELREALSELWAYPRYGVPFERGGRWFQMRNPGLANQSSLYVMDAPEDAGKVLLDPNTLSEDGTVAVAGIEVSHDGRLLAFATSTGGSDWMTWHVRDVTTGADLPDVLEWSKFGGAAWLRDGSGFFYSASEAPAEGQELLASIRRRRVKFHRIGTDQASDEILYEPPDGSDWLPDAFVTDDGRFVVIVIEHGTFPESQIHVIDRERPALGLRPLVGDFSALMQVVTNLGTTFYVLTDSGAERRRIIAIDLDDPAPAAWREVVPESGATLVAAHHCGSALVCHYLSDAHSELRVHSLAGEFAHEVTLPGLVSLDDPEGAGDSIEGSPRSDVFHFNTASYLEPGSIWSHDVRTGETVLVRGSSAAFDSSAFVTDQVFVTSADGTRVPLFVSRRRDVVPTGEVPVLMHGYGGFNIPITPSFRVAAAVWMERGGVFADAVLRGGGEYGRAWNEAGRLANKQNVFDDFAACARYFATSGWSRAERIAICGASNGGLLVGASITQHPELFGAAVAEVGVLDMLRFHKFTIGWAWTSDYGNPDDPEQYQWVRAFSPLHNVIAGTRYPATLIMTGDHDDRVVPGHSFKFAATLQPAQGGTAPVLLRVETSAGHGHGKPTAKQIAERTDFLAFIEEALRP